MAPTVPDAAEVEATRVALQQAFERLRAGVDACVDAFNHIIEQIEKYRHLLGAIAYYIIRKRIAEIRKYLTKALDIARKVLRGGTPVLSLFLTSLDYLNAVHAPLGDISYDINKPGDDNINYWTGGAGGAYRQKQGEQKAAADKSAENAAFLSTWLFDIGKTNVTYATETIKLLIDICSGLVNVSVDGVSIIAAPLAVDRAAEILKKLLQAGLNQLVELANKFVATLGDYRSLLKQGQSGRNALSDGKWPQAVYTS